MVYVAVVVPTFKRPTLLARCLEALLAQNFAPEDYEVIIVDDAACEQTRYQIEQNAYKARMYGHNIRYIPVTATHGPAAARNIGWRAAHAEIIAFTDDDCVPSPGWLKAGMNALCKDVAGVAGRIVMPLPRAPTDYEYNASQLAQSEFVTANCFFRRDALTMVGGFDERFSAAWREDSDLIFMLLEHDVRCIAAPDAVVIHPIRSAQWGISIRQQRKSMYNALLYKKHPALYRQKVQATPPWHYYGIVCALLVLLIGVMSEAWLLALISLGIWVSFTGRFCALRLQHTSHSLSHTAEMIVTSIVIPPLAIFWRLRGAIKFRVFFL